MLVVFISLVVIIFCLILENRRLVHINFKKKNKIYASPEELQSKLREKAKRLETLTELLKKMHREKYGEKLENEPEISNFSNVYDPRLHILDSFPIPIWIFDPKSFKEVYANKVALDLWSISAKCTLQEFQDKDFSSTTSEATLKRTMHWLELFSSNVKKIEETWTFFPGGIPVRRNCIIAPYVFPSGRLSSWIIALEPNEILSEKYRSELIRSQECLRHTSSLVCLYSMEGRLLFQNPSAARKFGMTISTLQDESNDESLPDPQKFLPYVVSRQSVMHIIDAIRMGNKIFFLKKVKVKIGEKMGHHMITVYIITDVATGKQSILVTEDDITDLIVEKKKLRKEETRTSALKTAKMKAEIFLSSMSHEIRTPLHGIIGLTQALLEEISTTGESRRLAKCILNSGEHLLTLVNNTLDISKLEAERLQIKPSHFDTYKSVEQIIDCLSPVAQDKGLTLSVLMPVNLPVVKGDSSRIGQILLNFLSNAIKFSTVGNIEISAHLSSYVTHQPPSSAPIDYYFICEMKNKTTNEVPEHQDEDSLEEIEGFTCQFKIDPSSEGLTCSCPACSGANKNSNSPLFLSPKSSKKWRKPLSFKSDKTEEGKDAIEDNSALNSPPEEEPRSFGRKHSSESRLVKDRSFLYSKLAGLQPERKEDDQEKGVSGSVTEVSVPAEPIQNKDPQSPVKYLHYMVKDPGPGIKKEDLPKLFERFSQLAHSFTRQNEMGTGLGLFICRELALLMGGAVGVMSKIECGSTFWLSVPFVPAPSESLNNVDPASVFPISLPQLKVIVLDEREFVIKTFNHYLRQWDIPVNYAKETKTISQGNELLKNLDMDYQPDLIFISATLSDRSFNLLQDLKERFKKHSAFYLIACDTRINDEIDPIFREVISIPIYPTHLISIFSPLIKQTASSENEVPKVEENVLVNMNILLVEDNKTNQIVATNFLKSLGCKSVKIAGNGSIGVDLYSKDNFNIILMDIQMPVMDGFTAASLIRKIEKENNKTSIPIIALTASHTSEIEKRVRECGMNDILSKPFQKLQLLKKINENCK